MCVYAVGTHRANEFIAKLQLNDVMNGEKMKSFSNRTKLRGTKDVNLDCIQASDDDKLVAQRAFGSPSNDL